MIGRFRILDVLDRKCLKIYRKALYFSAEAFYDRRTDSFRPLRLKHGRMENFIVKAFFRDEPS